MNTLENIEASLARWHRRLNRAAGAIKKLEAKRKRFLAKQAADAQHWPAFERGKAKVAAAAAAAAEPLPADGSIPQFLRRTPADIAAADAIRAEQADRAKRKKAGQDAKRKAARRGETKRMPLQGRAALERILTPELDRL